MVVLAASARVFRTQISVNNVYCVVCADVYTLAVRRERRISNLWPTRPSARCRTRVDSAFDI